jgi:subfamily B ATP-binding cassette protein MsbA
MGVYQTVFHYIRRHMGRLVLGLVGMAIFTLLSLLPPLLLRFLLNDIVELSRWELLGPIVAAIVAVPMMTSLLQFGNNRIIMQSGYRLVADMRLDMYDKILNLSMRFHQDHSSGVLVNRLMDDVNMLQQLITGDTVNMLIDIIVFLFSVTIVFLLSPLHAVILAVTLVLYVLAYRTFSGRIRRETQSYRSFHDTISERLQETISGVRHVRIYNREFSENSQFLDRTNRSLDHALSSNLGSVSLSTVCTFIAGVGSASMVALGAYYVLEGRLQYGDVLAISNYVWMALNPAIRLTNLAGQLTETFVSVRRVVEILNEDVDIRSDADAPEIERKSGKVEFENVDFSYVPESPLYRGLDLTVEPGMTVALVGHTGCGKTTLTQLLMRHWDIQGGAIRIDGQDIRHVDLRSVRRLFGVVLQNPVVFDGTLSENIAYGVGRVDRDRIEAAARAAEIHQLAARLPSGYDTVIGTRGVKLSVGEKQRLSIARAIIKDPLILIMDEATSSLDSESEALIQKALSTILKGRTSFVVAHRLSTITNADMIVVMDKGAIIERGRHEELMKISDGTYRQLYEELRGTMREETA